MKIELDLKDVFVPSGPQDPDTGYQESIDVPEAIREAVIARVIDKLEKQASHALKEQVDKILTETIKTQVEDKIKEIMPNILDHEFTETTSWGERKGTYTVRNRILQAVESQCVYKKDSYGRSENVFSKTVSDIVESKISDFGKQFKTKVDEEFTKQALELATTKLKEKLGIK